MNAQSLLVGFTLDPVELAVLRQAFGVRSRLFPLRLGDLSVDPLMAEAVRDALDSRGLTTGPHSPARTAFELLAEHRVAVSVTGSPGELTALAVAGGDQALTIVQPADDELRLTLLPAEELVGQVVGLLPPAQAAAGVPVVVGPDACGADRLAAQLAGPRTGGGLLAASGRGRRGLWADMIGWVDTAAGRHLVRTSPGRARGFSAEYSPAGPRELRAAVLGLLEGDR
ncbi:ESX secretion-associated protein EspG [Actinophytocola sp.]|uniref:ESX secretion-associated protein EspG n=1 Tax=Actinophytocola sp. TaxID=1872138 RepID=UPI002D413B2D|nr:ESX secretion-associated protein EspG [Actinophytocola sp.]HYQ69958.1 ESX secretion-associated protein EspG [Actinophytocola sp.]